MAGVGIMKRKTRPSAGLGGDIVVSLGVPGLEGTPVSHEAEHHSNAARIVNPVSSHCVYKPESLEAAGFECTQRIQQDMSVKHRIGARLRRGPRSTYQFICYCISHFLSTFLDLS